MEDSRYKELLKRAKHSITLIVITLAIGTLGFHFIEGYSYVYSFFFSSMMATGEGPPTPPVTQMGQIFASVYSFVAVGSSVTALLFLFGPFFSRFLKIEENAVERDVEMLEGGRRNRRRARYKWPRNK